MVACREAGAATYLVKALAHAREAGGLPLAAWQSPEGDTEAAFGWLTCADLIALYVDYGVTDSMSSLAAAARALGVPVEYRTIQPAAWASVLLDEMRAAKTESSPSISTEKRKAQTGRSDLSPAP